MVTTRQKKAGGFVAAALLLLGSAYAWQSTDEHKTNEFKEGIKDFDVTLVEDFQPVTDWEVGQEVQKDISVLNSATSDKAVKAYVRIQLREFLELAEKKQEKTDIRYAVDTAGHLIKFAPDKEQDAIAYAAENGYGTPVQLTTTAFEGDNYWFLPTLAGSPNGQYGKFIVLSQQSGAGKSILDATVSNASADAENQHQALTHGEDAYTLQTFKLDGANAQDMNGTRFYDPAKLVYDVPTGGGLSTGTDLKDYITWNFGEDVIKLKDFDPDTATKAQWVIGDDGWVYWSRALAPGQTTSKFLDSLVLTQGFSNASLYYAIHTHLEAVDIGDLSLMNAEPKITDAWRYQRYTVTFNSQSGTPAQWTVQARMTDLIPEQTEPAPPNSNLVFAGWYDNPEGTGTAWDFSRSKMPSDDLTLYAKWKEKPIAHVYFKDATGAISVLPDHEITASNKTLTIPDGPTKANHYFLGWAETPDAAKTATLYVSNYDPIQSKLNTPDQTYLGYAIKPDRTIQNITADKTLYAVYYKGKDAVTADGDEFIWANAIWRNLKTDMDETISGKQALVIKANALTTFEATGSGATTGYYTTRFLQTQTTYFSSTGANGYDASDNNVRKGIDYYYDSLSTTDKASVNAVNLNNPTFAAFSAAPANLSVAYNAWSWGDYYKDTRFETKVDKTSGSKQAFALSYGDINKTMNLHGGATSSLLSFVGSNVNNFSLRSVGSNYNYTAGVTTGNFNGGNNMVYNVNVRPALSLQIN